jgi:hypothetical protein
MIDKTKAEILIWNMKYPKGRFGEVLNEAPKDCALKIVTEVINELKLNIDGFTDNGESLDVIDELEIRKVYWESVKKEIESKI